MIKAKFLYKVQGAPISNQLLSKTQFLFLKSFEKYDDEKDFVEGQSIKNA